MVFDVRAIAWFQTAVVDLADLNTTVVSHIGTVNLARGQVRIEARRLTPPPTATHVPTVVRPAGGGAPDTALIDDDRTPNDDDSRS